MTDAEVEDLEDEMKELKEQLEEAKVGFGLAESAVKREVERNLGLDAECKRLMQSNHKLRTELDELEAKVKNGVNTELVEGVKQLYEDERASWVRDWVGRLLPYALEPAVDSSWESATDEMAALALVAWESVEKRLEEARKDDAKTKFLKHVTGGDDGRQN